jgi:hypothetical protein
MKPLPGSGNHLEDALDDELDRENKRRGELPCGCFDQCKCDEDDDA